MELSASILLGIGLAAAVGFRIFVPLLAMSLASRFEIMQLSSDFEWISSTPAMLLFATATIIEILAYYIPWIDNLLDGVTTPLAMVCGTLVMASTVIEMEPWIKWTLAIIAGGGTAGLIKASTTTTRATSTMLTAGIGNPIVSSVELIISGLLTILSILLPVLTGLLVIGIVGVVLYKFNNRIRKST